MAIRFNYSKFKVQSELSRIIAYWPTADAETCSACGVGKSGAFALNDARPIILHSCDELGELSAACSVKELDDVHEWRSTRPVRVQLLECL